MTRVEKAKPQISTMLQIVDRLLDVAHHIEDRSDGGLPWYNNRCYYINCYHSIIKGHEAV